MKRWAFILLSCLCGPAAGAAEINFSRDIRPILSDNCFQCHGPDANTREADLRLDEQDGLFADRDGVTAVVPGEPSESELIRRIISRDEDEKMPPADSKLQLSSQQVELLRKWVEAGAPWEGHWAFQPVKRPAVPPSDEKTIGELSRSAGRPDADAAELARWPRNAIDHFVLRRLVKEGLSPAVPASKERLLRRVTLDLTGLPPTLDEIDAFLADDSENAYETAVDRLLESRSYGERMAWDWLDAARYADTNGFQGDRERTMWPWRDWVVQSLNDNMPFDRFTVEQIAGDLLPSATLEQKLATAFCRNHMINGEGGRIAEENRIEYIFDQTETIGTVWLGLTLTCCRCHDHKYDPLSRQEYFQLFAFFNQTPVNGAGGDPQSRPVIEATSPQQQERIESAQQEIAALKSALEQRAVDLTSMQRDWEQRLLSEQPIPSWSPLLPTSATAAHQTLSVLDDRSVLAGGTNPKNDTYTITANVPLDGVTGLRLDALRHASLTKNSLSRAESGNFVLTQIEISIQRAEDAAPQPVKIAAAEATFEQGNLTARAAFDGNSQTGWAVYEGRIVDREHAAVFRFEKPLEIVKDARMTVVLRHDSPHANHNLGRFRLSLTSESEPKLSRDRQSLIALLRTPSDKRTQEQAHQIAERHRGSDETYRKLADRIKQQEQQLANERKGLAKVMVMEDMPNPRKTLMLEKGLYNKTGDEVTANVPRIFSPLPSDAPANRLALARWLVDPSHPLTARVTVNRFWQTFFGTGLVKTPEDFGAQGDKPSHPELLDWLAAEFVESGWDVKALVKLIVTSATYRQTARGSRSLFERDPDNRLLARGPRHRMPSWMIRDHALAASGLLVRQIGGPSVYPYQPQGVWAEATFGKKRYQQDHGDKLYRRSLYTFWRRIVGPTMFFDAAKRQTCSVKATRTNTPLHALITLNDVTFVEAARAMAQRVMQSSDNEPQRVATAFRLAVSRSPTSAESEVLLGRLKKLKENYETQPADAARLLAVGESPRNESLDAAQHAAYTGLCLLLLNLDEALTN